MSNLGNSIINTLIGVVNQFILFIPKFVSGLIILIVGLIVASAVKAVIKKGAQVLRIDAWLERARIEDRKTTDTWINVAAAVVYWFILLSFLVPTFNAWQIPAVTAILNQFVFYLPNVFAAVIIGFVGVVLANLVYNISRDATVGLGRATSVFLGNLAKYAIIIFAGLMALNQLNVSSNLIQILVAGLVAMLALAGGLALGLGGRDLARGLLEKALENRDKIRRTTPRRGMVYAQEINRSRMRRRNRRRSVL